MPIQFQQPYNISQQFNARLTGAVNVQDLLARQRAEAIRWQGAQDYSTLVQSGVEPRQALQRTAPKLFFGDPRALSGSVPSMLSQPGGMFTDPNTGRQFTVDRWGVPRAIPQEQLGWTTVTDKRTGQIFRVPIQRGNVPLQQGGGSPYPIIGAPGGSQYFVSPGKTPTRIIPNPNQNVMVQDQFGNKVPTPRGQYVLQRAQQENKPQIDRYRLEDAKVQSGDETAFFGTYRTNTMNRIKAELAAKGLNPDGTPIEGSLLWQEVYGDQATPTPQSQYQLQPPPVPAATPPPGVSPPTFGGTTAAVPPPGVGAPGPAFPPPGVVAPPPRTQIVPTPPTGTGFTPTPATVSPPVRQIYRRTPSGRSVRVPGFTSRQAMRENLERNRKAIEKQMGPPPQVSLGANEGLFIAADETGRPRYAIFNTETGAFVDYAD